MRRVLIWLWLFLAPIIGIAGTYGYDAFVPVIGEMTADQWRIGPDFVQARVVGKKLRDCEYVRGSEAGFVLRGHTLYEVAFVFPDDIAYGNSRPPGFQSFGIWRWQSGSPPPEEVLIRVQHRCGKVFKISTIGPFTVPTVPIPAK